MYIYLNESKRIEFTIGLPFNSFDTVDLHYRKPDGTEDQWIGLNTNPANDECYVDVAANQFNQVGTWTAWAVTTKNDDEWVGDQFQFEVRPRAATITTLEFVKKYLNIQDNDKDFKIQNLIPVVEQHYLAIRNSAFSKDSEGNIVYPIGSNVTAAEMIDYIISQKEDMPGYASRYSLGKFSIERGSVKQGYPSYITSQIKQYTIRAL